MTEPEPGLATAAVLDILSDGSDELLGHVEGVLQRWGFRDPRSVARQVLRELTAAGHVEYYRWESEGTPSVPISVDEGLRAVAGDDGWEFRLPAVTVLATDSGEELLASLPAVPQLSWPDPADPRR